jgi:oligopeptide/dipeptide ABC transporter ATP-binding protein
VFTQPRHPYTALLMASAPSVKHDRELTVHQLRRTPADPEPPSAAGACVFAARCPFAVAACAEQPPLTPVTPPAPVTGHPGGTVAAGTDGQAPAGWSAACHRQAEWPDLARARAAAGPRR